MFIVSPSLARIVSGKTAFASSSNIYSLIYRVESLLGALPQVREESRFVVEQVGACHLADHGLQRHRVGNVGIHARRVGVGGQGVVRHNDAVGRHIVIASLDVVAIACRHLPALDSVGVYVPRLGLFTKHESHARQPMDKRHSVDRQRAVFINDVVAIFVGLEAHVEVVGRIVEQRLEQPHSLFRQVYHSLAVESCQAHCGEQSRQSIAVVAMQMRYENVAQSVELAVRAHQLSLSALAAVNQKRF